MNDELKTKKYLKSLESITLSDSSRARIKGTLLEYARFHTVSEAKTAPSTPSQFFAFMFRPAPMAFVMVLFIGATTSVLMKRVSPEDFASTEQFPVANVDGTPLEQGDTSAEDNKTAEKAATQTPSTQSQDAPQETVAVPASFGTQTESAPENIQAKMATDSTMLSQGTWSIKDYAAQVTERESSLRTLIKKYDADINTEVKAEFKTKLDSAATLLKESDGKPEDSARADLDKASERLGEVESKLSTLGQVEVKDGMIVSIDFSIDPMQRQ